MSRVILVSFLTLLMAGGCVKNELDGITYFNFKDVYLYTVCRTNGDQWPPLYDTINQMPDGVELSLVKDNNGFSCYKNNQLIFKCSMPIQVEPELSYRLCVASNSNLTSYSLCDNAITFDRNPFENFGNVYYYQSPVEFPENCGPCSYSVWRKVE